jgi:predicted transcriptional regulator
MLFAIEIRGTKIIKSVCEKNTRIIFEPREKRSEGKTMLVKEIMNKNSVVCTEDTSLEKVFELMTKNECDFVSVVESRAHPMPIGTITEHDICLHIVGKGRNPRGMTAANVLNTNVVKAGGELSPNECLNLMKIKSAERIFVVDEDGMLCGSISRQEIEKLRDNKVSGTNRISETPVYSYNAPGINRIF